MNEDVPPDPAPVEVQIRFERFPASIRGAFVLRGADGNPHAVRLVWARLARLPAGQTKPVTLEDRLIDVAPAQDLFVPFEVPVADLEPAWYGVECSVQVDAGRLYEFESRPFTIPWPRSDVRRGSVVIGRSIEVGGKEFVIDRVDLTADCAVVSWRAARSADEPAPGNHADEVDAASREPKGEALLFADGRALEVLPPRTAGRAVGGKGSDGARTVTYPVPRDCNALEVVIALPSGPRSESIPISLP